MSETTPTYFEKTFKTALLYGHFAKLAARTCQQRHWITVEGCDRSMLPVAMFLSVIFSTIEDRDRFMIALRFAENERAIARSELGTARPFIDKAASAKAKQLANA